jgi:hypothetical protein
LKENPGNPGFFISCLQSPEADLTQIFPKIINYHDISETRILSAKYSYFFIIAGFEQLISKGITN